MPEKKKLKFKKRKVKKNAKQRKVELLNRTETISGEIKACIVNNDTTKSLNNLMALTRSFFSDYFKIKFEFTFEELIRELEKKKIIKETRDDIEKFLYQAAEAGYGQRKPSADELKTLVDFFTQITKQLEQATIEAQEKDEERTKKRSLFRRLIERIFRPKSGGIDMSEIAKGAHSFTLAKKKSAISEHDQKSVIFDRPKRRPVSSNASIDPSQAKDSAENILDFANEYPELVDYVKRAKKAGHSAEEIRKNMAKSGWPTHLVDEFLDQISTKK